jgi:putative N6-adenine-specific DNA methylase
MTTPEKFFAPCPRGLEQPLARELAALGAERIAATEGGVAFEGGFDLSYRVNLWSRVASRVLWYVAGGAYRSEEDIYKLAMRVDWTRYFDVGQTFAIHTVAQKCPLKSLNFVTLRIKDAVCDRFREAMGGRPSVETRRPDIRIHAFLDAERVTLYLDTSGEALFKRGWRKSTGEAPLRENLAAGILMLAGWEPGIPLLDPMCGSGTFLMEAAMMALDIAPGLGRGFGFENLLNFDGKAWARMRREATAARRPMERLAIYGSDLSGFALGDARKNFGEAGLSEAVTLEQSDVLHVQAPAESGILVANPPYGERIGDQQALAELYPQLGSVLKQRFAGWTACIFTADTRLPKLMRLQPSRKTPLFNGPLECRLYQFKMVAGSNRPSKP